MDRITQAFFAAGICLAPVARAEPVDYRSQVLPLLSENCFNCHGPDPGTRKGGLRLDRREEALRPAESGEIAIVPGNPAASRLITRMITHDPEEIMPPPESKKTIHPTAVGILRKWIEQGAQYRSHWAFDPLVRPAVPGPSPPSWVRNPVDAFILDSLAKHQLQPSPEAPGSTLLRRLSLDLTGLPPTPEELSAYLSDNSAGAYEAAVDRLLASPHYGERMALPWLDAARYADSNGFQQDGDTHQYVWRDWVVRALNNNMPFDQFTVEQLAGDLLPNPSLDQKIASAFNRNHLLNGEGGAIPEEQRNVILVDRVDVTATTWLGLTMACAQCHDHKYDPIPQRDFYRMMAFFNQVPETGMPPGGKQYRIADPWIHAGSPEQMNRLAKLEKQAAAAAKTPPAVLAALADWEDSLAQGANVEWTALSPASASGKGEITLDVIADNSVFASGGAPDQAEYHLEFAAQAAAVTGIRIDTIPDARLPKGGAGLADSGNAVLTRVRVSANGSEVSLAKATADYAQIGFSAEGVLDDDPTKAWAFHPDVTTPHFIVAQPAVPIPAGQKVRLVLEFRSSHARHLLGRFRISFSSAPDPVARQQLPGALAGILAKPATKRTAREQKAMVDYFIKSSSHPAAEAARKTKETADSALAALRDILPKVMVMSDAKPRKTHIHLRGVYTALGDEVEAGTPECLPPMKPELSNDRLGLAKWLISAENPLTARVQVNRYWQLFFGSGLIKTSENLGVQADAASHPDLLDWLAAEFRDKQWDVKHIHRLIVTSAAYRQSSKFRAESLELDPGNKLISRAPRFRLSSPVLRDLALASSGLLNREMGGKPVYPYQPPGIWDGLSITKERDFTYPESKGADLYRRSLYTFWRRTVAPGNMFDASSRTICSVKPSLTNTPIHALITLNDITWNEAARALAANVIRETTTGDTRAQLSRAWLRVCSRQPDGHELEILRRSFDKAHREFQADPQAASRYLAHGEGARDLAGEPAYVAALSAVCLSILNLDEALTRE
ncbi:MAG: hypothetical protein RLZZ214_1489 [Verrucomicrobiota bacterium]|jgi:hypothetical protein